MKKIGLTAALVVFAAALWAATQKQFRADLSFYRREAVQKKLNANDRLYILNRLREKYADASFDVSELYAEIDRASTALETGEKLQASDVPQEKSTKSKAAATQKKSAAAVLKKWTLESSQGKAHIWLKGAQLGAYEAQYLKSGDTVRRPALVLYLYHTQLKISARERRVRVKTGPVLLAQARQTAKKPATIKMVFTLRQESAYEISAQKDGLKIVLTPTTPSPVAVSTAPAEKVLAQPDAPAIEVPASTPTLAPAPIAVAQKPPAPPAAPARSIGAFQIIGEWTQYDDPQKMSHLLHPGSIAVVQTKPYPELGGRWVVPASGKRDIPLLGETPMAGLLADDFARELEARFTDAVGQDVKVSVKILSGDFEHAWALGEISRAGIFALQAPVSCAAFLQNTAGPLLPTAQPQLHLFRVRGNKLMEAAFNWATLSRQSEIEQDCFVEAGDILEAQPLETSVFLAGAFRSPQRVAYNSKLNLLTLVKSVGGFERHADLERAVLFRVTTPGVYSRSLVDLRQILIVQKQKDFDLLPGDILFVPRETSLARSKILNSKTLSWSGFVISIAAVLALIL